MKSLIAVIALTSFILLGCSNTSQPEPTPTTRPAIGLIDGVVDLGKAIIDSITDGFKNEIE